MGLFGGGSGGSIDTGGITGAAQGMQGFANDANQLAHQNYNVGQQLVGDYEIPLLNLYKKLLLNPSQYTDPNFNVMMGLPLQQGQQAATAATKNLTNMGLGPIATQTGKQQIDLTKMGNAQTGALQNLQQMFTALLGAGQQGTNMMSQVPGQVTQAGSLYGQSGQLYGQLAKLQADAQKSQNQGLFQGLAGIGSIAGMLGGSLLGGPVGGAIGGAVGSKGAGAGGAAADGTAGLPAYNPSTSAYGDFGLGTF
jgi:hypothetical protein